MRCRLDERVSQLLQHTDEGRGNFKKEVKPTFTKDVTYKGIFLKLRLSLQQDIRDSPPYVNNNLYTSSDDIYRMSRRSKFCHSTFETQFLSMQFLSR